MVSFYTNNNGWGKLLEKTRQHETTIAPDLCICAITPCMARVSQPNQQSCKKTQATTIKQFINLWMFADWKISRFEKFSQLALALFGWGQVCCGVEMERIRCDSSGSEWNFVDIPQMERLFFARLAKCEFGVANLVCLSPPRCQFWLEHIVCWCLAFCVTIALLYIHFYNLSCTNSISVLRLFYALLNGVNRNRNKLPIFGNFRLYWAHYRCKQQNSWVAAKPRKSHFHFSLVDFRIRLLRIRGCRSFNMAYKVLQHRRKMKLLVI